MKKLIILVLFALMLMVLCSGCGQSANVASNDATADEVKDEVKIIDEIPKDQRLNEFNEALGVVTDEVSATSAVEMFVDYVDSRLIKNDEVQARGNGNEILSDELISSIARKQAQVNNVMARGESVSLIGITPENVSENINSLVNEDQSGVSEELVADVQSEVRKELPNLASDENENMKPIEALVVGYVIYSGDDGGAGEASVDLGASNEQIQQYVENILE